MLDIDWPTEWDPDFRETLRLRLETSLRNVMSKSRNSQLRGNVVVEDVFPGTVSPQVRLKHIHSLEPSLIAFSIAVRYEGDAYIALSGLEINLDTTSGTSNRKAAKVKDGSGSKIRGDRSGGGGVGSGGSGGDHNSSAGDNNNNSTSSRSHTMESSTANNNSNTTNSSGNNANSNHVASNEEDGMYSGDANHSLPFYCPFAMRLCNIVIEDTVDVQIITTVVDERPEYYFGKNTTTASTYSSTGGGGGSSTISAATADDSTTSSPSPALSPQQGGASSSPTKASSSSPGKKTKPVMPLHVLVKSLQYSEHIDATLPEEFAHILQHQSKRKVSDDAFAAAGGVGEFADSSITGRGAQHNPQPHSQISHSAVALIGEVMRGDDLSGSTSSSSANTGTPLQPLTTETLHKQQLLEKKKSDVINASARSAAESPRVEAVSMARSSIAGGSRTMDVLYGGRNRHSGGGGAGRQAPGGSNLYSVARRGMRGAIATPRPSSIVPQRKDFTTSGGGGRGGGGDKSSGSSGSVMDPHLRQTSWSGATHTTPTPDNIAPPSNCSGNTLRGRAAIEVPHRLPRAVIRTPRDDEIKAGGALPVQTVIRRGGGHHTTMMVGGGEASSGNSPPHSASHMSRVLTPISKLGVAGSGSKGMNSSSLTGGGGWPLHRGGWGSSFAFAAGAPQIHAAGKRAEINTRQRDFLATCLEPFSPFYPEGLSFLPPYWNLSAYNHITGAGSALDSVVSQTESQCKSFADLFVFGRFKRVQKGAVSRREQLLGNSGHGEEDPHSSNNNNTPKGGTIIRLQFFSDPIKSFNVTSNFGSVHTRVNTTIESTLRNLVQPAIDKLLIDGIEFTV